jgi:hypothetical protein
MLGQLAASADPAAGGAVEFAAGAFVESEVDGDVDVLGVEVDDELSAAYAAAPPPPTTAMVATATIARVGRSFMWVPPFVARWEAPTQAAPGKATLGAV